MKKDLKPVGSIDRPGTVWTTPVEKVKNDNGKYEYIVSLSEEMRKFLKLKEGSFLFWGERSNYSFEVRKAKDQELHDFKIKLSQQNAIRQAKTDRLK